LQPEELKQLRLEFVIAKALAGQMNEIKGWVEAAGPTVEHTRRSVQVKVAARLRRL
jgi:hypothetical protein